MVELIKKYVENRLQLVKLNLIAAIANVAAGLVSSFLLLIMGVLVLLMFSIALAFWLSTMFESEVVGFAMVGGMYLLFFVIYMTFAKDKVEMGVKDTIVSRALAEDEEFDHLGDQEEETL